MKPAVLTGVVVGVALLLALAILPRILPSTTRAAVRAQDSIADAHGALFKYDPLAAAAARSRVELDDANLDQLVSKAESSLQQIAKRSSTLATDLQRQAREAGVRIQTFTPISANAASVREAVNKLAEIQRQNQERLSTAERIAGDVRSSTAAPPAASHLAGLVKFAQAASQLAQAQEARMEQHRALERARVLGFNLREAENEMTYFEALRAPGLIEDLRQTQGDLAARREEVATRLEALRDQVRQRQERVAERSVMLGQKAEELEQLKEAGGAQVGADQFAQRLRQLAGEVRDLQLELQVLQNGGLKGATLNVTNGLLDALIEGGEPVRPLGSLQEELAGAEETHQRLAAGESELAALIDQLDSRGRIAGELLSGRREFADAQRAALQDELTLVAKLAGEAQEFEAKALQDAQSAASSFAAAAQAAGQWKSAARSRQSDYDPERKNWRLSMVQGDTSVEALGTTAAAEARKLALQAHLQRITAAQDTLATIAAVDGLTGSLPFEPGALRQQISESKESGRALAGELIQAYEGTIGNQLPAPVKGLASASLAAVHRAQAQLELASTTDPQANADAAARELENNRRAAAEQLAAANRAVDAAVAALEKHPSVGPRLASFRVALTLPASSGESPAPAATTEPAATQETTAEQPSEDLFDDG